MIEIKPGPIRNCRVKLPGSKSHTHRALVAAALANGESTIVKGLLSEDTQITINALEKMGVAVLVDKGSPWRVMGKGGRLSPWSKAIHLGNSGTSMRLLAAVAALGEGAYTLKGTERMHQRPMGKLIDGLRQAGVKARAMNPNDCPPVVIDGQHITGGHIRIDCSDSSQYLSALLLIAPVVPDGMQIDVTHGPVSRPYIDMTLAVMEAFGITVERQAYSCFTVNGGQTYQPSIITVEPDASNASYFWAAAAVMGVTIVVDDLQLHGHQGDVRFVELLGKMGCKVKQLDDGISVTGGKLKGIDVDMSSLPDMVPTLAVVAAFADGTTHIRNVEHLRIKECDRLSAVSTELAKMGIDVETDAATITVYGGNPRAAIIDTYDDHRMAMGFAVAGLKVPGLSIRNEMCVAKSFPSFWQLFNSLYP